METSPSWIGNPSSNGGIFHCYVRLPECSNSIQSFFPINYLIHPTMSPGKYLGCKSEVLITGVSLQILWLGRNEVLTLRGSSQQGKWLITMVIVSHPKWSCSPSKWPVYGFMGAILTTGSSPGMILQVTQLALRIRLYILRIRDFPYIPMTVG